MVNGVTPEGPKVGQSARRSHLSHEGSYVKPVLGGRVARGHRSPSRMWVRRSLRSALTGHP